MFLFRHSGTSTINIYIPQKKIIIALFTFGNWRGSVQKDSSIPVKTRPFIQLQGAAMRWRFPHKKHTQDLYPLYLNFILLLQYISEANITILFHYIYFKACVSIRPTGYFT